MSIKLETVLKQQHNINIVFMSSSLSNTINHNNPNLSFSTLLFFFVKYISGIR